MSDEYEPATCITAGELRAMGASIPPELPDCGWVPRDAVTYGVPDVTVDGNRINCAMTVKIGVAFQWFEVRGTIGEADEKGAG